MKGSFGAQPAYHGRTTDELVAQITDVLLPYDTGNTHARSSGWVHGAGTPEGTIPALFDVVLKADMCGREHAAVYLERPLIDWWRDLFGFPARGGGLIVSGTSMATILALKAALTALLGQQSPHAGLAAPLRVYTSWEAHSCVARALDLLGLGRALLRLIAVDEQFRLDVAAPAAQPCA